MVDVPRQLSSQCTRNSTGKEAVMDESPVVEAQSSSTPNKEAAPTQVMPGAAEAPAVGASATPTETTPSSSTPSSSTPTTTPKEGTMSNTNVANKEAQSTTNPNSTAAGAPAVANNANGGETTRKKPTREFKSRAGRAFMKEVARRLKSLDFDAPPARTFMEGLKKAEQVTGQIDLLRSTADGFSAQLAQLTANLPAQVSRMRAFETVEELDLSSAMLDEGYTVRQLNARMSSRSLAAVVTFAGLLEVRATRSDTKALARQVHTAAKNAQVQTDRVNTATIKQRQLTREANDLWRQVNTDLSSLKQWLRIRSQYRSIYEALFVQARGVTADDVSPAALKMEGSTT